MNAPSNRAVVAALMMTSSAVAAGAQPARVTVIGPVVGTESAQIRSVNGQATQSVYALPVGAFVRVSGFVNEAGILVGDHVAVLRASPGYAPTVFNDPAVASPSAHAPLSKALVPVILKRHGDECLMWLMLFKHIPSSIHPFHHVGINRDPSRPAIRRLRDCPALNRSTFSGNLFFWVSSYHT